MQKSKKAIINNCKRVISLMIVCMMVFTMIGSNNMSYGAIKESELKSNSEESAYVEGQLLIKYSPQSSSKHTRNASIKSQRTVSNGMDLISVDKNRNLEDVINELENMPGVEYVEPNYIVEAYGDKLPQKVINDKYNDLQWALTNVKAYEAWDNLSNTGKQVTVAVIDTGIDYSHPDLDGKILKGKTMIKADSYGNYYDSNNPYDDNGHGTHVSGIIAATCNNAIGVAGISGETTVKILPIKVLNDAGKGSSADIVSAIIYAADNGADIINMSLGSNYASKAEEEAVNYAIEKGCMIFAAAGNDSSRVESSYPASYNGVIAVGATNKNKERAWFSNYGTTLDIMAPGEKILSTVPELIGQKEWGTGNVYGNHDDGYYMYMSGTSMASPYAAGIAALYLTQNPNASTLETTEILTKTAEDLNVLGKDNDTGWGEVDSYAALNKQISTRKLGFLFPRENRVLYGDVNISVQVGMNGEIKKVALYIDEINQENILATLDTNGLQRVEYKWDTTSGVQDGSHKLYAVAIDENNKPMSNVEEIQVIVKNNVTDGLMLKVADPNGETSLSAKAEVFVKGSNSYRYVDEYYSNESGYIRIPYISNSNNEYYTVISGKYEEKDTGIKTQFIYNKYFNQPGTYMVNGSNAVKSSITMEGLTGKLDNFMLSIGPIDKNGNVMGFVNPIKIDGNVMIDVGKYELYAFWNPKLATSGDTKVTVKDKETYFLTRQADIKTANENVNIDSKSAGKILVENYGDSKSTIYITSDKINDSFGLKFADTNIKSNEFVITKDNYKVTAVVSQTDQNTEWKYYFNDKKTVTVNENIDNPLKLSFGKSIHLEGADKVNNAEIEKGGAVKISFNLKDDFGNRVSSVYGDDKLYSVDNSQICIKRTGDSGDKVLNYDFNGKLLNADVNANSETTVWPTLKVYDSSNNEIYSYRSSFYLNGVTWDTSRNYNTSLPPDVGRYKAVVEFNGGPLASNEKLQKTTDVNIISNQKLDGMVRDRQNKIAVKNAYIDIYKLEPTSDEFELLNTYRSNNNGIVEYDRNLNLSKNGVNLAVVTSQTSDLKACTVKIFKNIEELKSIDFTNTRPVKIVVNDKSGNSVGCRVNIPIVYSNGQNNKAFVKNISFNTDSYYKENIYLDYGQYDYIYTNFNIGSNDMYLLGTENVNVPNSTGEQVSVVLDGRSAARISAEKADGFTNATIYPTIGANKIYNFAGLKTDYFKNIYVMEGLCGGEMKFSEEIKNGTEYTAQINKGNPVKLESGKTYIWKPGKNYKVNVEIDRENVPQNQLLTGNIYVTDENENRYTSIGSYINSKYEEVKPNVKILNNGETAIELKNENLSELNVPVNGLSTGLYRVQVSLPINKGTVIVSPDNNKHMFNVVSLDKGSYNISVPADSSYDVADENEAKVLTVVGNAAGLKYFTANIESKKEHYGQEAVIFEHIRNNNTIESSVVYGDFDKLNKAAAGFNVKSGDKIKIYIIMK